MKESLYSHFKNELSEESKRQLAEVLETARDLLSMSDHWDAYTHLLAQGWEVSGEGSFSTVLRRPSRECCEWVIKIAKEPEDGFVDYAHYCVDNPNLLSTGIIPRIAYLEYSHTEDFYVCVMEKLKVYPENPYTCQSDSPTYNFLSSAPEDIPYKMSRRNSRLLRSSQALVKQLRELMEDDVLDLHRGNVMFRGNVPVLTDPLADSYLTCEECNPSGRSSLTLECIQ